MRDVETIRAELRTEQIRLNARPDSQARQGKVAELEAELAEAEGEGE